MTRVMPCVICVITLVSLTHRYTNDPRDAVRCFNLARKDGRWGSQSILHMVEVSVCLCVCVCVGV